MALEHLDHLGEVGKAARQAVNLVDHHDVDQAALDVRQQALQPRAICIAAGKPRIVVIVGHRNPALDALAGHKSVARFLLRVDGVELLIESLVRGHPAVHGATLARLVVGNVAHS